MTRAYLGRPAALALLSAAAIGLFFVLREHWGHVLGYLPYLVLLLCPLLHVFHMRGHGGHDAHHPGSAGGTFTPP